MAVPELTEVTTLPPESSTLTTGWVPRGARRFAVVEGWVVMTSWVAAPVASVKVGSRWPRSARSQATVRL